MSSKVVEIANRGPLRALRGSLILALRSHLRADRDLDARFRAALGPDLLLDLDALSVGDWVPVETVAAYVAALDSLGLTEPALLAQGRSIGQAHWGTLMRTLATLAGTPGASPWQGLERAPQLLEHNTQGGGIRVIREGERRARVEMLAFGPQLAASDVFIFALVGAFVAGLELLAEGHHEMLERTPKAIAFELRWRERG